MEGEEGIPPDCPHEVGGHTGVVTELGGGAGEEVELEKCVFRRLCQAFCVETINIKKDRTNNPWVRCQSDCVCVLT